MYQYLSINIEAQRVLHILHTPLMFNNNLSLTAVTCDVTKQKGLR